jgi:hypothetical protein
MTAADYSGMRSLSGVCEQQRVIRAARAASLAEYDAAAALKPEPEPEYLYGIRDGQIVAFLIVKRTPKFIRYVTGNPVPHPIYGGTRNNPHAYVERNYMEHYGKAGTNWGAPCTHPIGVGVLYATKEAAEAASGRAS